VNSFWQNNGAEPINYFTTTWVVPPAPSSDDGQTVYLFNGLQPSTGTTWILQPVLQWGPSAEGGGAYWAIGNWYVPPPNLGLTAQQTSLIQVNPGDELQGVMVLTAQSASDFSYVSKFIGHSSIDLTVTDIPVLDQAFETLECYGKTKDSTTNTYPLTSCADYPATAVTVMRDIQITTGAAGATGTDADLQWTPQVNFTDCGQNCVIVSNDSPGGAVYLYYDQPAQNSYFINDNSFGKDQVSHQIADAGGVFPAATYLALDGFTLQQLTIDQPQLAAPSVSGPFSALTGVTVDPSTTYQPSYDPTNLYTPQRFLFPFDVKFTAAALSSDFPANGVTQAVLDGSITIGSASSPSQQTLNAKTLIDLAAGADPYFANVDPKQGNVSYLSQDLRVFTITPTADGYAPIGGVAWNFQGGSPTQLDTPAAYQYIRDLLASCFNATYSDPSGIDPFDVNSPILPAQGSVYGGDSSVTPASLDPSLFPPMALNYNFAIARVRLQGSSGMAGQASNVKVFFRLFTTQTFDTDYINAAAAVSPGDPNITYPSSPPGSPDQPASPLPGTDASGTINGSSLPYFAAANQSDLNAGGANNQTIVIPAGRDKTWTYFGCFLNVYDPTYLIGGHDSQYWLVGGSHSCLVAQIAYDGLPIKNSNGVIENPGNCPQLAQRNLQITPSGNPGFPGTHLIPQSFDTRPSPQPTDLPLGGYPDELMIDWGDTPPGTTATIYWPQVDSADVLALAASLYPSSTLASAGPRTLTCLVTRDMTYIPVPTGSGESFAGLITLRLPVGIRAGNTFNVVLRRITSRRHDQPAVLDVGQGKVTAETRREQAFNWRYVVGAFQMTIPVEEDAAILPGEENLLAVLKWRLGLIGPDNRWYHVLKAWISVVEQRVRGLGGDPAEIEPNQLGNAPLLGRRRRPRHEDLESATGKVIAIRYNRFGDFEGFELLTLDGQELDFHGREPRIEHLVRDAWLARHLITVWAPKHDRHWPQAVVLRRP
jgi:hypothetical protein